MADGLRSRVAATPETPAEQVLGDKATGGIDGDRDHVGNVEGGLKAAISNPNNSEKAKQEAQAKLDVLQQSAEVPK